MSRQCNDILLHSEFKKYGDLWGVVIGYNNLGALHKATGDKGKALYYAQKALNIATHLNKPEALAASYTNIGNIYNDFGNYEEALEYHFKALHVYEEMLNESGKAVVFNNVGSVYIDSGEYSKALYYLLQSFEINKKFQGKHSSIFNVMNC